MRDGRFLFQRVRPWPSEWNFHHVPGRYREGAIEGHGTVDGRATADGTAYGLTELAGAVAGTTMLPTGEFIHSDQAVESEGSQEVSSHADVVSHADIRTHTVSRQRGTTDVTSRGVVPSVGYDWSSGTSETTVPFLKPIHTRVPVGTQLEPEAEFYARMKLRTSQLPIGTCVVKVPWARAAFVRIPLVSVARLGRDFLERVRARIFTPDYTSRVTDPLPVQKPLPGTAPADSADGDPWVRES
jgi:hypothetical protein